ncbi:MAG: o-succinylbenzoate synthase [Planctomycetota bacterium]|jgi:O-succinylbenzoate synthase
MIVEEIELRIVSMPLVHPFRTSFGVQRDRWTVIVAAKAGMRTGYGESPVARTPGYSYETTETAFHVLRDVFSLRLVGVEIDGPADLPRLFRGLKGHPMARAGLEGALWDLRARIEGVPLSALHGGTREAIDVGVSVGIQDSVDALLERIRAFLDEGYRRVKIKIEKGWDVEVAKEVRRAFPDLRLWADANQAYERKDLERMKAIDEAGLELLEQPLHRDDILGHAAWRKALDTPICLDEGVGNEVQLETALGTCALGILNLKPPRVGGARTAIRIEERAVAEGVPVWCGGLLETGVGRLHNVALASREGFSLPGDLSASNRYFRNDLVDPPVRLSPGGTLQVPRGPGLGHAVDGDLLERVTRRRAVVRV